MFAAGEQVEASQPTTPVLKTAPSGNRRARRVGVLKGDPCIALKWAKDTAGLSSNELARRLGVKPQSVKEYMNGKRKNPGVEFMARWLAYCGFDLEAVQR